MRTRLISLLLCVTMGLNLALPAFAVTETLPQPAPDAAVASGETAENDLSAEENGDGDGIALPEEEQAGQADAEQDAEPQQELPAPENGSETEVPAPELTPAPEEDSAAELPAPETPVQAPMPEETGEPAPAPQPEEAQQAEETPQPEETGEGAVLAPLPRLAAFNEAQVITADALTRAEWLQNLVTIFSLTVDEDNMPDAYFPDVTAERPDYKEIMTATEYGFVDVEAGGELCPDEPATRAFVASTLALGLGVQPEEKNVIADIAGLSELEQTGAHAAVELGWFDLNGDKFEPQNTVSAAEVETMTASAQEFLSAAKVEGNNGSVTFAGNVKVFPEGTEVSFTADDDPVITIAGGQTLAAGDLFAVYTYGVPNLYKAVSVTADGAVQTVTTERPGDGEIAAAVTEMEIEGSGDISLDGFTPAEGFEAIHVTNEAQIASIAQTYGLEVEDGSVIATQDIKLDNGCKVTFAAEISNLKLKQRYSFSAMEAYIGVTGDYSVSSTASLDVVQHELDKKSITVGTIPVFGIGTLTISVDLALDGKMVFTYSGDFEAGMQLRGGNLALTNHFGKTNFSSDIEANAQLGVKADFAVNVLIAQGNIWATTGIQAIYTSRNYDSGEPVNCSQLDGWWYVTSGAQGSIGILDWKKESKPILRKIYDKNNSPVRLSFHWEDGVRVYECTRQDADVKYFTPSDSRYGSSSYHGATSTGTSSSGQPYTIYELSKDEGAGTATITQYHGNVSALSIPSEIDGYTIVEIGYSAFSNDSQLKAVVIPDTVTKIGSWAFGSCINLTTVTIPKDMEVDVDRGGSPFIGCTSLRNVIFAEGTSKIGASLFRGTGITTLTIPKTVTQIGERAFEECENLQQLIFEQGTEPLTIGDRAFRYCTALTDVVLPNNLTVLNSCAFGDCTNLRSVFIPKDVRGFNGGMYDYISYGPFGGCTALCEVKFAEGITTLSELFSKSGIEAITIPETVEVVSGFSDCTNLKHVQFHKYVTTIEQDAFSGCTALAELDLPDSLTTIGIDAFSGCTSLQEAILPPYLEEICHGAFAGCTGLKTVFIPKDLKVRIGPYPSNGPFNGCSALENVTFAEGTTLIDEYLLEYSGLKTITIPETVKTIGQSAFDACRELQSVQFGSNLQRIGDDAFYDCEKLQQLSLPDSVTNIGWGTFQFCPSLEKVKLSEQLTSLPRTAFEACSALTEIAIPDSVTGIEEGCFANCEKLKTVDWSQNLTSIGQQAFENCANLVSAELPFSVEQVSEKAFNNCDALTTVSIPGLKTLEKGAFYDCDALTDVHLGLALEYVPVSAFEDCGALAKIVIPYKAHTIDANAFKNCTRLVDITIPRGTNWIDTSAFNYRNRLVIYGVQGSYAQTFAEENGYTFTERLVPAGEVHILQPSIAMDQYYNAQLYFTVDPENFTDEVTWTSQNPDLVTVDETGTLYATGNNARTTVTVQVGDMSASCEVTVGNPPEEEPLPEQFEIEEEKHVLLGVKEGTTPEDLREELEQQGDVEITDKNGDPLRADQKVGTGCQVKLPGREDFLRVMIPCDVDGTGGIDLFDLIEARKAVLDVITLEDVYLQAAQPTNGGGTAPSLFDIIAIRKVLLGAR